MNDLSVRDHDQYCGANFVMFTLHSIHIIIFNDQNKKAVIMVRDM